METGRTHPPELIDGGAVLLRSLRVADAGPVAAAVGASLEQLRPWMEWATPEAADPAGQRARIADARNSWAAGTEFGYTVRRPRGGTAACREPGALLGLAGLHRRAGEGAIVMGYWVHTAHTGHGYATAAARALTAVALALPGVRRVEIHCDVANLASAAIPRKLGYRLDRIEDTPRRAPAHTGHSMIWVLGTCCQARHPRRAPG